MLSKTFSFSNVDRTETVPFRLPTAKGEKYKTNSIPAQIEDINFVFPIVSVKSIAISQVSADQFRQFALTGPCLVWCCHAFSTSATFIIAGRRRARRVNGGKNEQTVGLKSRDTTHIANSGLCLLPVTQYGPLTLHHRHPTPTTTTTTTTTSTTTTTTTTITSVPELQFDTLQSLCVPYSLGHSCLSVEEHCICRKTATYAKPHKAL